MATLKEKRTCGQRCHDFGRFVWNPDDQTFMGRTPEKWVYISLYYVAFYVVMTALFSLAIYVMMYTLSPYHPDYQDRLSSPGVMVWPDKYVEDDVDISYNMSDKTGWSKLTNCLKKFLHPYNTTVQEQCNSQHCSKGKYFIQNTFSAPHHTKWSCAFTQSMLGNCSGLEDENFGYPEGNPCVVIKMNRIIGFLPGNGTGMTPYVNCTVLQGKENVKRIEYFPTNGTFDRSYFPYYGNLAQPTYVNPLVAVKFYMIQKRTAKVQCRVVAENIAYQNIHDPYEGKVLFYISVM